MKDGAGAGGKGLVEALIIRGVRASNAQSLVADHPSERVADAILAFDQDHQRQPNLGGGVLVKAIREGRKPRQEMPDESDRTARNAEFAGRVRAFAAWCHEHLGDVCGPELHLGAFQWFFRRNMPPVSELSVAEHAPSVRTFVEAWEQRWA